MRRVTLLLSLPALVATAQPTTRELRLTTPDGFVLSGILTVPEGRGKHPVVILAHQYLADRSGWAPLSDKLHARGIATLALDLRGHGASTERMGDEAAVTGDFMTSARHIGFDQIPADLERAAAWVRRQPGIDGRYLGLAGSSLGAFSALLASPRIRPTTILALSPAGQEAFGSGAREQMANAATRAHAALMAYVSSGDQEASDHVALLRPIYGTTIRTFDGTSQGFDFLDEHSDVMAVFFAEYLLHPRTGRASAPLSGGEKTSATVLTPSVPPTP